MSSRKVSNAVVESLESRRLMSGAVQVFAVGDTLMIRGSTDDDRIALSQDANGAIKVQGLDGTCVDQRAITTAVKSVQINMLRGDDSVEILSTLNVANFSYNGGAGDNQLISHGNVNAAGTITINGQDATAAHGGITLGETLASMAKGYVDFSQKAASGAKGSLTLAGLDATAAKGSLNVDGFFGVAAVGNVQFASNVIAGDTIMISDGNPAHKAQLFTAVAAGASTVGIDNPFVVGANRDISAQNLADAITARHNLGQFDVSVVGGVFAATVDLTNIRPNGARGNNGLTTNAPTTRISLSQMHDGKEPAREGDTITLNDGQGGVLTFTAKANPVANSNEFGFVAGNADATLQNLANKIAAPYLTQGQKFSIALNGGYVAGSGVINLTNTTVTPTGTTKTVGAFGNQAIVFNSTAWGSATDGMKGGTDDFVAGDYITLDDGIHAPKTFTAIDAKDVIDADKDPVGARKQLEEGKFAIGDDADETADNLAEAINAVYNATVPNAASDVKYSFIEAQANWKWTGEGWLYTPGTLYFTIQSDDLIGQFAGQAEKANSTTFLTDASGQWIKAEQFGRDLTGKISDATKGINALVLSVGDKITLNDGVHPAVTFTAVAATATPAANQFQIAYTPHQQAINFAAAVNAAGLNIAALPDTDTSDEQLDGEVTLTYTRVGTAGNGSITSPRITFTLADPKAQVTSGRFTDDGEEYQAFYSEHLNSWDFSGGADVKQEMTVGDWIVIGDGVHTPVVFTAIADTPVAGSPNFQVGADLATTRQNLINAINGYVNDGVKLTLIAGVDAASHNRITLVNTTLGEAGNFNGISGQNSTNGFDSAAYLCDGENAVSLGAGATVTLNDGAKTVTFTAVSAGTTPGANQFVIGATKAETAANLAAAINAAEGFNITATTQEVDGKVQVLVSNDEAGTQGNQKILVADEVNGNLWATGMDGGSTGSVITSKDLNIATTGVGSNVVELNGAMVGRRLTVQGGGGADTLALANVTVASTTNIRLCAGDDVLTIDGSSFKGVFYAGTGAGDDVIAIDSLKCGGTTFCETTTISAAGGADVISDSGDTRYTTWKDDHAVSVSFLGGQGQGTLLNNAGKSRGRFDEGHAPTYQYVDGLLA